VQRFCILLLYHNKGFFKQFPTCKGLKNTAIKCFLYDKQVTKVCQKLIELILEGAGDIFDMQLAEILIRKNRCLD
jgi:hypothetical protein